MFIRPQQYKAKITRKQYLTENVIEIVMEVIEPVTIKFHAGQFVSLEVAPGEFRAYSITSPESENKFISLLVEVSHQGKGANLVRELEIGDEVTFIGPSGKFTLPPLLPDQLIFVATGVGFAPFESMFSNLALNNYPGKINFFFGIRSKQDLFKIDFLLKISKKIKGLNIHLCFSREMPDTPISSNGRAKIYQHEGRVTQIIPDILKDENISGNHTIAFLCGNPLMIEEVITKLQRIGIKSEDIIYEKFN